MKEYNTRVKYYPNGTAKYTVFDKSVYKSFSDDEKQQKEEYAKKRKQAKEMYFDNIPIQWIVEFLGVELKYPLIEGELSHWECWLKDELFPNGVENEKRERFGNDESRADNIKRAKDKLFDIALVNSDLWNCMVTFTLDKEKINRYDRETINRTFKAWLMNMTKRRNLKYLVIPEYHKDGAIHFHGLINIGDLELIDTGDKDNDGRKVFRIKEYKLGRNWVVPLDENCFYVAKYITKYITKDTKKIMGNFYYCGGGLIRDVPFELKNTDYYTLDVDEHRIFETGLNVKYQIKEEFISIDDAQG